MVRDCRLPSRSNVSPILWTKELRRGHVRPVTFSSLSPNNDPLLVSSSRFARTILYLSWPESATPLLCGLPVRAVTHACR